MLLVQEVYIAKPGHAGEFAKMMKDGMKDMPAHMNIKVLLDSVTDYNKVVIEYEVESLATFETMMNEEKSKQSANKEEQAGSKYTDFYLTGRREIFRIV